MMALLLGLILVAHVIAQSSEPLLQVM